MSSTNGFEKLQKQLKEATKALENLDGELGKVSFDPNSPESIDLAISEMESLIDEKLGQYAKNPLVSPMITAAKEQFRQSILDKAAEARLEEEQ